MPLAAISTCVLFEATKNNRIDRMIGDLSYPVYLVHVLVMQLVQTMISRFALDWSLLPWLNVAGSLVMAFILIMIVDKRIEIIRQRIYNRSRKSDAALPD